jgi:hypothetical protein
MEMVFLRLKTVCAELEQDFPFRNGQVQPQAICCRSLYLHQALPRYPNYPDYFR